MDFEKGYHEIWDALAKERDKNACLTAALKRIVSGCEYLIEIGEMEPDFIFADAVQQAKLALTRRPENADLL